MEHTKYCQDVHGPEQMRGVHECDICGAYTEGLKQGAQIASDRVAELTAYIHKLIRTLPREARMAVNED